jgi:anti-sigma28 factor (negative regulator of flagellin synthesis)
MRAEDQNLAQSQATQQRTTSASQPAEGADRMASSGLAGRLARALAASSSERASRVQHLAQAVAEGRYQADPRATARALVREAAGAPRDKAREEGWLEMWGGLRWISLLLYRAAGFYCGWPRLRNVLRGGYTDRGESTASESSRRLSLDD